MQQRSSFDLQYQILLINIINQAATPVKVSQGSYVVWSNELAKW